MKNIVALSHIKFLSRNSLGQETGTVQVGSGFCLAKMVWVSAGLPSFLESVEESPFQGHCGAGRIQALAFVGLRFHSSPTGCRLGPVSAPCGQAGIPSHVASSGFTPAAERKSFSCFQTAQHSHCAVLDESEDERGSASGSHPPGLGREPFLEFFWPQEGIRWGLVPWDDGSLLQVGEGSEVTVCVGRRVGESLLMTQHHLLRI